MSDKTIWDMELNEKFTCIDGYPIYRRVPGGWLVTTKSMETPLQAFIPYSDDLNPNKPKKLDAHPAYLDMMGIMQRAGAQIFHKPTTRDGGAY